MNTKLNPKTSDSTPAENQVIFQPENKEGEKMKPVEADKLNLNNLGIKSVLFFMLTCNFEIRL